LLSKGHRKDVDLVGRWPVLVVYGGDEEKTAVFKQERE